MYYPDEGTGHKPDDRSSTFQLKDNVKIYGGFAGTEHTQDERNWRTNITVLSGDLDQNDPDKDANGVVTNPKTTTGNNAYHVVTGSGTGVEAQLNGFTITAGHATDSDDVSTRDGGGMLIDGGGPNLWHITFAGNGAHMPFNSYGGGLHNNNGSDPQMFNIIFRNNYAAYRGGALSNIDSNPQLANVLMIHNEAGQGGGGIHNLRSTPALINMTVSANQNNGLFNWTSNPVLTNVILWENDGQEIANIENSAPRFRHSLIQGSGGSNGWDATLGIDDGNNLDEDPRFVNAANDDFSLLSGSPAVNVGQNSGFPAGFPTDLVGNPRIQKDTIDLGSYESAWSSLAAVGDLVWHDVDADGLQDEGEPGVTGVTISLYLSDALVATVVSDDRGIYQFRDLNAAQADDYSIRLSEPSGYQFTNPNVGNDDSLDNDINPIVGLSYPFTLVAGQENDTVDVGLILRPTPTAPPTSTSVPTPTPTPQPPTPTAPPTQQPTPTPGLPNADDIVVAQPDQAATVTHNVPNAGRTQVTIPAGAVDQATTFLYNELDAPTEESGAFQFAGRAFTLTAYRSNSAVNNFAFQQPATVELTYTDADLQGVDEAELTLLFYDTARKEWSSTGITIVTREPANNRLVVQINHLTEFVLAVPDGETYIYLPNVLGVR